MSTRIRAFAVLVAAIGFFSAAMGVAQADIYWTNRGNDTIGKADGDGTGSVPSFITGVSNAGSVAVDGTYIYWTRYPYRFIGRATLDGTQVTPEFIALAGSSAPTSIAVHGNYLYWIDAGLNSVGRAKTDGTEVITGLMGGGNGPSGIAVTDSHIYWGQYGSDKIARADLDGSNADLSFIAAGFPPLGLATDADHIYWVSGATMGRANLDGTSSDPSFMTIGDGSAVYQVAADDAYLYWAGGDTNSVGRAKLDGSGINGSFITGGSLVIGVGLTPTPLFAVSPQNVPFGDQRVDVASAGETVTVTNTGVATLDINTGGVTLDGDDPSQFALDSDTCSGASLSSGQSCTVSVTFTPTSSGAKSAAIAFETNRPSTPHLVPLTGTGVEPVADVEPTSIPFGNQKVSTSSSAQTVTVTNNGTAPLAFGTRAVTLTGTDPGEFEIRQDSCSSATIAVGDSCTAQVRFSPTATGAKSADLSFASDAPSSPDRVSLTGTGTQPAFSAAPSPVGFADQNTGTTSAPQTITVTNTGTGSLVLGSVALAGANAGQFDISSDTCSAQTVAPAGTCTVQVRFAPTSTGAKAATVSFPNDAPGNPHAVAVSGTGVTPGFQADPHAFGSQRVGGETPPWDVTVTNTGTGPLTFGGTAVTLAGTDASQFRISADTCSSSTVAAAGTCNVTVVFGPTTSGAKTATLEFTDNAAGSPQSVELSGTGVEPIAGVAPASLTFGNQKVATSSPVQTVTVTNQGSAALLVGSVSLVGADPAQFSLLSDTCSSQTIAPSGTCTVQVRFSPASTGSKAARVSVASDAPGSPHTVSVSGTGVRPALSPTPNSLAFGDFEVGTTSAAQTVTVTNAGQASLVFVPGAVTLSGPDVSAFAITGDSCSAVIVAPGSTCAVSVAFTATSAGDKSATVLLTSDAPASPTQVPLTGTGVAKPVPAPAAPTSLKLKASKSSVKAKWTASTGATSYRAVLSGSSSKGKKVTKSKTTTSTKATLKAKVKPGTKVKVCVTAMNSAGSSTAVCKKVKVPKK